MHLLYASIVQLSRYKIFVGHSILNTMLLSSWLIFSIRGRITFLNLYHTIKMLKLSYTLLNYVINGGFPFWFINFDLTKEDLIKFNTYKIGEFYVTRRWIRGLISNYFIITKAYRKYLIKKDFIESNKVKDLYSRWILTRFTWPRSIFISNAVSSFIASKEAASAKISSIVLVDTNVKTFLYNIPVGCNDDSMDSIAFMLGLYSQYVIRFKYKKVLVWYYFNRNIKRYNTILEWLNNLIKLKKKLIYKIYIKDIKIPYYVNYYTDIKKGLNFFFGRSYNFNLFFKNIKKIKNYNKFFLDDFYSTQKIFFYNKLKVLSYKISSYKNRLKFRRYELLNRIEGISSFKSFLNNSIKLNGLLNRKKRIKIKRRFKRAKRAVSKSFKFFFSYIFFFFLNKFNIMIDSYNKKRYNILYLIKISKNYKNRRFKYSNKFVKKYNYDYVFRFKSKKIYKRKRLKKYSYNYNIYNEINKYNMNFLYFYWKYFIIFLGLKLRSKKFLSNRNLFLIKLGKK